MSSTAYSQPIGTLTYEDLDRFCRAAQTCVHQRDHNASQLEQLRRNMQAMGKTLQEKSIDVQRLAHSLQKSRQEQQKTLADARRENQHLEHRLQQERQHFEAETQHSNQMYLSLEQQHQLLQQKHQKLIVVSVENGITINDDSMSIPSSELDLLPLVITVHQSNATLQDLNDKKQAKIEALEKQVGELRGRLGFLREHEDDLTIVKVEPGADK